MWPLLTPARGSASMPAKRPAPRASITVSCPLSMFCLTCAILRTSSSCRGQIADQLAVSYNMNNDCKHILLAGRNLQRNLRIQDQQNKDDACGSCKHSGTKASVSQTHKHAEEPPAAWLGSWLKQAGLRLLVLQHRLCLLGPVRYRWGALLPAMQGSLHPVLQP